MSRTAAAWCLGTITALVLTSLGASPIVVMVIALAPLAWGIGSDIADWRDGR